MKFQEQEQILGEINLDNLSMVIPYRVCLKDVGDPKEKYALDMARFLRNKVHRTPVEIAEALKSQRYTIQQASRVMKALGVATHIIHRPIWHDGISESKPILVMLNHEEPVGKNNGVNLEIVPWFLQVPPSDKPEQ